MIASVLIVTDTKNVKGNLVSYNDEGTSVMPMLEASFYQDPADATAYQEEYTHL